MRNPYGNKTNIPFTDVSVKITHKFLRKISRVIKNGDFILGKEVSEFEQQFAQYIGIKYCIGVASGTDAILIALRSLGVSQRDEVIVPAFTFIASATPILMLGARPVFVDIRSDLPVIDENSIEKAINKRTKAILIVHLYGYPCDLNKIITISKKYNLPLIEDASQAHGSMYLDKKVGSFADIGVFSFYPTKNLGAFGDAGAIVTSRKKLYDTIRLLRDHGQISKYRYQTLGYNSRLDSLQAAVLSLKLANLNRQIQKKNKLANIYISELAGLPIKVLQHNKNTALRPALHIFAIKTNERNQLLHFLKQKGISCMIHYPATLPDEQIFQYKSEKDAFINAREYASSTLSLPFFVGMTEEQVRYVAQSIHEYFSK